MPFWNPFSKDTRVARDLMNGASFRECAGGSYGDDEEDYTDEELERAYGQGVNTITDMDDGPNWEADDPEDGSTHTWYTPRK